MFVVHCAVGTVLMTLTGSLPKVAPTAGNETFQAYKRRVGDVDSKLALSLDIY